MPKDITKNEKKEKKEKKHFFKDFKAELKKVIWPTPKQLVNNTVAVITIVVIVAAIVLVLDLAFESLNNYGINKLRDVVGTRNEQVENTEANNENSENATDNTSSNNEVENETTGNNQAENAQSGNTEKAN